MIYWCSCDFNWQILEKTDYTMISGNPFIKKSGNECKEYSNFNEWAFSIWLFQRWRNKCNILHICHLGWRKISFYFNLSFEIKDKSIEFDENRNVQRAEFVVRAYMQYDFSFWKLIYNVLVVPFTFGILLLHHCLLFTSSLDPYD